MKHELKKRSSHLKGEEFSSILKMGRVIPITGSWTNAGVTNDGGDKRRSFKILSIFMQAM